MRHPTAPRALLLAAAVVAGQAQAFVVAIAPGARSLYLQVGAGTITGGDFASGGTPASNPTVNRVSVNVPAASLGAGPRPMTTDSAVAASAYNSRSFCTVPSQVYIGGFFRAPGVTPNATLSVTSPAALVNTGGNTIPFSSVGWTSGGAGDATPTIASGTFAGGTTQALLAVTGNTWFESCLQFTYSNSQLVPAGTFGGRVSYTLSAP
ncbi:MAG: hypothetical protein EOO28_11335 [Comamonadaceae bacterium]|nr:MAG: hypothetical protein EOO28_11335 [Comamonadaceae bacterium]